MISHRADLFNKFKKITLVPDGAEFRFAIIFNEKTIIINISGVNELAKKMPPQDLGLAVGSINAVFENILQKMGFSKGMRPLYWTLENADMSMFNALKEGLSYLPGFISSNTTQRGKDINVENLTFDFKKFYLKYFS
jgi:hypothetical protein